VIHVRVFYAAVVFVCRELIEVPAYLLTPGNFRCYSGVSLYWDTCYMIHIGPRFTGVYP